MRVLVHRTNERLSSDPDVSSDEIVPIAEGAIRMFERLGDSGGLAAAENLLGHALGREGRTEESFAAYGRALALAEAVGDQVTRRDIIGHVAGRLCESSIPAGEAIHRIDELRAHADDPVLDAGVAAVELCCSRWPAASTRPTSTSWQPIPSSTGPTSRGSR